MKITLGYFLRTKFLFLIKNLLEYQENKPIIQVISKKILYPTQYILFDAPLGYHHTATGEYIDFLVCLDTPLDIALARRIIRDFEGKTKIEEIIKELKNYLSSARPLFILSDKEKRSSFRWKFIC